jgi:hypothetical protein
MGVGIMRKLAGVLAGIVAASLVVTACLVAPAPASARVVVGVGIGIGPYWGWPGPYPYPYAYPYVYGPPAVIVAPPPYVAAAPAAMVSAPAQSWYYCDNPQGYYPYVASCAAGWRQVPAQQH